MGVGTPAPDPGAVLRSAPCTARVDGPGRPGFSRALRHGSVLGA